MLFLTADTFYKSHPIQNASVVYHDNHNTTINFIDNGTNYILHSNPEKQDSTIEKKARNFWMKNRIENIIHIKDNSDLQNLIIRQPFIYFKGNKIYFTKLRILEKTKKVLIFFPSIMLLSVKAFQENCQILPSYSAYRPLYFVQISITSKHQALQKEADQFGIFCYSIKKSGAWIFNTDTQLRIPSITSD